MAAIFTRRIAVIGAGYVGLTMSACLASLGHKVVSADVDSMKVNHLRQGKVTILEPGLSELVREGLAADRLDFVVGAKEAVSQADVVFLCVPTPMGHNGTAELDSLESAVIEVRELLPPGCVVVNKSTVPVGTARRVANLINRDDIAVVSNPEFLREGSAVQDFLHPDRIVVGSDTQDAAERIAALYARLGAPTVLTDAASAEMIKYSANCFLAMKLSYVNAVAELCEHLGANIADVTEGIGYDRRIGQAFLQPGPGWGGSCLPKDTHALMQTALTVGVDFPLLQATISTNVRQQHRVVAKIRDAVGGQLSGVRIGVLGLAFKAGTGDIRESPALVIAALLANEGAELIGYDPGVPCPVPGMTDPVQIVGDPHLVAKNASALVVLTEWPEFRTLDWCHVAGLLDGHVVIDTRNHLDPAVLSLAGLECRRIGYPSA